MLYNAQNPIPFTENLRLGGPTSLRKSARLSLPAIVWPPPPERSMDRSMLSQICVESLFLLAALLGTRVSRNKKMTCISPD